jgi:hypothetical protein
VTKSPEEGDNDVTDEARREAVRSGKDVCQVLAEMLRKAKRAKDQDRQRKIVRAQKYLGCRNKRKRGRQL